MNVRALLVVARAQFASPLRLSASLALMGTILSTALQLIIPAVLIRRWNDYGYALVLGAQGLTAYVSVSDLGMQATLLHRLTVLVARGSLDEARSVARTGLTALAGFSATAAVIVIGVAGATRESIWRPLAEAAGSSPPLTLAALAATAVSTASAVCLGGWSTSVEYARGRYVLVQAAPLLRSSGMVVALLGAAMMDLDPAWALIASAAFGLLVDVCRFAISIDFLRGPTGAPLPLRSLAWQSRGGPVYAFGLATSNGLIPALLSIVSPAIASAAVPGRTVSNGARLVANTVGNAIWVPLAARMESLRDQPVAQRSLAERTATMLAVIQCASLAAILLVAPWAVPIWLPTKSAEILGSLPTFLIEQALLVLAVPAQIRLMAAGRFMAVGIVTLAGAVSIMVLLLLLVPRFGVPGYAASVAVAAAVVVVPALLFLERQEWQKAGLVFRPAKRFALAGAGLAVVLSGFASSLVAAALAAVLLAGCLVVAYRSRSSRGAA